MNHSLRLIVHDYDPDELAIRVDQLRHSLGAAEVKAICGRHELLSHIASLPAPRREPIPVALIDLQEDQDRRARGEHLIRSIHEHPDLRGRVAVVAFTRYGGSGHDELLQEYGAQGILHPAEVVEKPLAVATDLFHLARGERRFTNVGGSPSLEERTKILDELARLFPGELSDLDDDVRWDHAKRILAICRMTLDGYDNTDIKRQLGATARELDRLRGKLASSADAIRIRAVEASRKADLGAVARHVYQQFDDPEARWILVPARENVFRPVRILRAGERVRDRFGDGEGFDAEADPAVWMPPESLGILREFLAQYEAPDRRGGNERGELLHARSDGAIERTAAAHGHDADHVRRVIEHAILCLEEADLDDPPPDRTRGGTR